MKKTILCILATVLFGCLSVVAQQNITLEDIWLKGTFSAKGISEIRSMLKNKKKPDGEPYMPRDIAILTRSNKEASCMANALAQAGIPHANSTGNDLFENPEVLLPNFKLTLFTCIIYLPTLFFYYNSLSNNN